MNAPTLTNNRVKLSLLDLSNYKHIIPIGQQDKLVQYSPTDIMTPESLKNYAQMAVDDYYHKTAIPFIIYDKEKQAYAGSTRYMNIHWKNRVLEIGSTWIGREFQGTGLNKNMKFLMLQYAFEEMKFDKVEFRVDERNTVSRKAVESIGGVLEGILRKNVLMLDGFKRNTCCYGITKEEWIEIKGIIFKQLL
ncbi:GNAT family protein [Yeosuana sp. MJ-SS3]|uniref:GNAT family protein n=1 Tax=Gilvirhabdus luticola TaxID=3079858 RepID=A0ABU3U753_9FLAO|nr:GNAT family protein [Yeosuana sp. MJ-SS3]MDU8886238.1 GNAT family protein [Yeosuana sp. MJ-SS3]